MFKKATLDPAEKIPAPTPEPDVSGNAVPVIEICGVPVINTTRSRITEDLMDYLESGPDQCRTLFFLNAHGMSFLFSDTAFTRAMEKATWILNDGIGMDMAAWILGQRFRENLNGSDLVDEGPLLEACATKGFRVFLLGGRSDVLDRAVAVYEARFPGLTICGRHHGFFAHESPQASAAVIDQVNRSGADLLLVGMGNPIQETWLEAHRPRLRCGLAMGIGGSIDQVAGHVPRAPTPWIRCRLEWFYRLCQEPRRLWRRYLLEGPFFLMRVLFRRPSLFDLGNGHS